jgi:hypothetical protein
MAHHRTRVSLLDIGLDDSFDASMTFVQATIQNINAGMDKPLADVDFVRTRDPLTILSAFVAPCDVLHVMAHGDRIEDDPTFSSSDGRLHIALSELGERAAEQGRGISTGAILADGCRTATGAWQKAVRDCLQGDVTYIGSSGLVGWHDSTVFCSAFYGAMFRNRGRGYTPQERALDAAERAIEAFGLITDRPCPFKVMPLQPSRFARTVFDLAHR